MSLDTSKVRAAVEMAIRNSMTDCGINPSGPEVKTFVDYQLKVLRDADDGIYDVPEVPAPAATVGPVKPVNG